MFRDVPECSIFRVLLTPCSFFVVVGGVCRAAKNVLFPIVPSYVNVGRAVGKGLIYM